MESRTKTITLIIAASAVAVVLILFSQGIFNPGPPSPIPNVTITEQTIFPTARFDENFDCTGASVHARFHIENLDDVDGFVEAAIIRKVDGFREGSNLFFIEAKGSIQETLQAESNYCEPGDNLLDVPEFEVQIVHVRGR